ncbi:DUF2304 domain-containing protein [Dokdonella immobilis]|uniref:DUF2304 domain-containing protein n=1 Tax=Dokdonella immobilis TaxID=578942 RepID=A0A1I4WK75_9GAMM|nr:DUF2304 domain-containing protein [Dokdonella immobilis]SFN13646.1 hypothetical protein SAMN05216289_10569 [Dokdonella immobilis]
MLDAQITAAILGVGLAGAIFYLVRRDHLHGPFAAWWLMVAASTLVLGMFPALVIWLGKLTGINYAPVLPIIIGLSMVLLRLLKLDIDRSRQERQMRRLTQKLAILEQELEQLRKASAPVRPTDSVRPPSASNTPS